MVSEQQTNNQHPSKKLVLILIVFVITAALVLTLVFVLMKNHRIGELDDGTYTGYFVQCTETGETITIDESSSSAGGFTISTKTESYIFQCTATSPKDGSVYVLNIEPGEGGDVATAYAGCERGGDVLPATVIIDREEYDSIVLEDRIFCVDNPFTESN